MAVSLSSPLLNAMAVSGSVSQGETSLEWSQPFWGHEEPQQGALTVSIDVDAAPDGQNYAPHGVFFKANVTGFAGEDLTTEYWDAATHRLSYIWKFDDDGAEYEAPLNLPAEYRSRDTAVNREAAHVYRKPGKNFVEVLVFDMEGNWGTASVVVETIRDDFTASEIIVVAPDGNFTGAPYCATANKCTTAAQLRARITALGAGAKSLILLKRGGEYSANDAALGVWGFNIFRAWGSGAKPVILNDVRGDVSMPITGNDRTLIMQDIHFKGGWNSVTELNEKTLDHTYNPDGIKVTNDRARGVFDRCSDDGMAMFVQWSSNGGWIIQQDHVRTNFKNFMCLGGGVGTKMAFLGCRETPTPGNSLGSMNRGAFTDTYLRNPHNFVRSGEAETLIFDGCEVTAANGWTIQYNYNNNPIIRANTNGSLNCHTYIARSFFEGQVTSVDSGPGPMPPSNVVMQQCIVIGDVTTNSIVGFQGPGWTVRDNLLIHLDPSNRRHAERMISFYPGVGDNLHADWDKGRIEVYDNTLVLLTRSARVAGNFQFISVDHPGALVHNNAIYAPNLDAPNVADGPFELVDLGFGSLQDGVRRGYERWVNYHTPMATTAPNGVLIVPYGPSVSDGHVCTPADFDSPWKRNRIDFGAVSEEGVSAMGAQETTGQCAFSFQSDGIHITNLTSNTWPSGQPVTLIVDRGRALMPLDNSYVPPAGNLNLYAVSEESGAYGTAEGWVSPFDLLGRVRRGSAHPDAAPGTPSRGALEVV